MTVELGLVRVRVNFAAVYQLLLADSGAAGALISYILTSYEHNISASNDDSPNESYGSMLEFGMFQQHIVPSMPPL